MDRPSVSSRLTLLNFGGAVCLNIQMIIDKMRGTFTDILRGQISSSESCALNSKWVYQVLRSGHRLSTPGFDMAVRRFLHVRPTRMIPQGRLRLLYLLASSMTLLALCIVFEVESA